MGRGGVEICTTGPVGPARTSANDWTDPYPWRRHRIFPANAGLAGQYRTDPPSFGGDGEVGEWASDGPAVQSPKFLGLEKMHGRGKQHAQKTNLR
eukprot:gene11715-biopygen8757